MATPAPDELAALRARAYGRGGQALSAEERARLAALEAGWRAAGDDGEADPPAVQSGSSAAGEASIGDRSAESDSAESGPAGHDDTDSDAVPAAPAAPTTTPRARRRAWILAAVGAVAVAAGVTGGFALGRATASNALPAAAAQPFLPLGIDTERIEASRGVVLAQSTWDELHLLGGAGDLLVWWGTSGAQTCIAIEARDLSFARACGDTAEVRSDGLAAAVGYQSDGALTQVTVRANPYAGVLVITRDNAAVG
ncbi:hypothetical protein [Microbacterium lacticum]|uniref:Uncharacterized protein n=1 Tax=Microbacterium lacticum TaxID=33885 RepID=A0A4Y3UIX4_9MICO|nr:hypothetical protein [Microbacterium lacticum]TQN00661.1 hypothetical protein FHX68_0772 [Microbacterium lacticum]GEB94062.1 hypothetical protein MLA01_02810 [Microbacterium lacticum]GGN19428.1 hypothetical protein GCM10009724_11750 [Microbacterium lacticum]